MLKSNLEELDNKEKNLIWKFRYYLKDNPKALIQFLHAVNWSSPD